jgi:hypothetical protein
MKIARVVPLLAFVVTAVTMFAQPVSANPIVWTLEGITFADGGTATGNFTYNAATDTYSNWNISVTAGPSFTAYTYQPVVDTGFLGIHSDLQVDFVAFPPATSGRYIRLTFVGPLTDAGGAITLRTDLSGYECNNCSVLRYITGGSVTTAPAAVPEPSTLVLSASGVLIGGLIKRFASQVGGGPAA